MTKFIEHTGIHIVVLLVVVGSRFYRRKSTKLCPLPPLCNISPILPFFLSHEKLLFPTVSLIYLSLFIPFISYTKRTWQLSPFDWLPFTKSWFFPTAVCFVYLNQFLDNHPPPIILFFLKKNWALGPTLFFSL